MTSDNIRGGAPAIPAPRSGGNAPLELKMDILVPETGRKKPLVVYSSDGGFIMATKEAALDHRTYLAEAEYGVASIQYPHTRDTLETATALWARDQLLAAHIAPARRDRLGKWLRDEHARLKPRPRGKAKTAPVGLDREDKLVVLAAWAKHCDTKRVCLCGNALPSPRARYCSRACQVWAYRERANRKRRARAARAKRPRAIENGARALRGVSAKPGGRREHPAADQRSRDVL